VPSGAFELLQNSGLKGEITAKTLRTASLRRLSEFSSCSDILVNRLQDLLRDETVLKALDMKAVTGLLSKLSSMLDTEHRMISRAFELEDSSVKVKELAERALRATGTAGKQRQEMAKKIELPSDPAKLERLRRIASIIEKIQ
jgi:hypothetical protein